MQNCFISLNQGFTQFREAFGDKVGNKKISEVAALAIQNLHIPADFIAGPLNLSASTPLGRGYESGAIISRRYGIGDAVTADQFRDDLIRLLDLHDELAAKLGPSLLDHLDLISSDDYQEAANEIATADSSAALPAGSRPRPPEGRRKVCGKI